MKVLLFSDLHFRGDHRDAAVLRSIEWICKEVVPEHEPDFIVHCGDTFESYTSIPIPALRNAFAGISYFNIWCGQGLFVLVGNHDQYSADRQTNSIDWMSAFPKVRVVAEGQLHSHLGLMPYRRHGEDVPWNAWNADTLAVHLPIKGVDPRFEEKHGFPQSAFMGKRVFCGHYHDPADIGSPDVGFFHIIGSLCASSFSDQETDIPRGVVLWEHDQVTRIANPHTPVYLTAHLGPGDPLPDILPPAHRVNLRVYAAPQDVDRIREEWGDVFASLEVIPKREARTIDRSAISVDMPMHEAVDEYVEHVGWDELDKDRLIEAGKDLLG